ncbi:MAG: hypothetical protein J5892_02305 [Bacilli bacterium]|nr:hypothetical protein [Bacilli bacterium]
MKKEEILAMNRRDNKKKDPYETEISYKATWAGALAMLILATVFYTYEICSGKGTNPVLYSLIAIFCSVGYGYKGIKLEKNRWLYIFTSVIWLIVTVLLILGYFKVI